MEIDQMVLSISALILLVSFGFYPLLMGVRLIRYCKRELRTKRPSLTPKVVLFIACKQAPRELRQNLLSLTAQDYPDLKVVFSVAREEDPATAVIREILPLCPFACLVIAGENDRCSEKNFNLARAVEAHGDRAEVYAFADSDVLADPKWLENLVAPLQDPQVGLTTGHPTLLSGNLWTNLALIWNTADLSTHIDPMMSYAIGSSMAIRRQVFEQVDGLALWRRSISDDQSLSYAAKKAGYDIQFVPQCITISPETFDFRGLMNWSIKELQFAQYYNPPCYWGAVGAYGLNSLVILCVLIYALLAIPMHFALGVPGVLVLLNVPVQILVAYLILRAANIVLGYLGPLRGDPSIRIPLRLCLLSPLVALVFLLNILATFFLRTIRWSGVTYAIRAPLDVRVIARSPLTQPSTKETSAARAYEAS